MKGAVFCMDAKLVVDAFNSNRTMFIEFGSIIKKRKSSEIEPVSLVSYDTTWVFLSYFDLHL